MCSDGARCPVILDEVIQSIDWIETDTAGCDLNTFVRERLLRQAVERNVEIISEASRQIPDELKGNFPQIPWRQIADIGNVLRDHYHKVSTGILWDVVTMDLPSLKLEVETMKASLGSDPGS